MAAINIGGTGLRLLMFLLIFLVPGHIASESLNYCIPCQEKYIRNVDFKSTCETIPQNLNSTEISVIGSHSEAVPCIPCSFEFNSGTFSQVCWELLEQFKMPEEAEGLLPALCSLSHGEVLFEESCQTLLDESPCGEGEWLLLVNGRAQCVTRNCPSEQIAFENSCVAGLDDSVCGPNQKLVVYYDGSSECVCNEYFVMDTETRTCYSKGSQGPCRPSSITESTPEDHAVCVPNLCSDDTYIFIFGKCFPKNDDIEYCDPSSIFEWFDGTLICRHLTTSIFTAGGNKCPVGEKRAHDGQCKKIFRVRGKQPPRSFPRI